MSVKFSMQRMITCVGLFLTLSGCFHPPYNNFQADPRSATPVSASTVAGVGAGAIIGSVVIPGAALGGAAGSLISLQKNSTHHLITELKKQHIEIIKYGDTTTAIIPTDRYFVFDTPALNELSYPGLINILKLLKKSPHSVIYVAGFTDNVGSPYHKKMLSQARAETFLTFLWANNIAAQRLHAKGYADHHAIGDNKIMHASAYNRRIELQWVSATSCCQQRTACLPGRRHC